MTKKLKNFLGNMDKTAEEIRQEKADRAKNTQELLDGLKKSRTVYFEGDGSDARATAAAEGFDVGDLQDSEYKIPRSRVGTPMVPFGFVPVYQRWEDDPCIPTDQMAALLAHPEDASEWPNVTTLMLACVDDEGEVMYAPCPIETIDKILPEWSAVMGAFRKAYAEYVKAQTPSTKTGEHKIKSIDDIPTAELAELLKNGRYTVRTLSEMKPKELRKVYKKYIKGSEEKEESKKSTAGTDTENTDIAAADTADEPESAATDATATEDKQPEAMSGSTGSDTQEGASGAIASEPPVIVMGNELNQFISTAIDSADPNDVKKVELMNDTQLGELYKALTRLYEAGQQATSVHVRVFVSRILKDSDSSEGEES